MRIISLSFCAALALIVTGCERPAASTAPAAPNGTVALLDLDAVAKRLGRDVVISEQLKATNDALAEGVTKAKGDLQSQLDKSQQEVGEKPTDEQKQQLLQLGQTLNSQLQTKVQEAREEFNSKQVDLVRQFREEVKPVAQKIAAKKGMNTVLIRSDIVVLTADTAVDITDDVVAEMITTGKGAKPAPTTLK
ncbi:MAG: OmpH family outer membrane protein [Chthoniobacterales bacterium]